MLFCLVALGADAFYNVVCTVHSKAQGKLYVGDLCIFEAIGAPASLAVEVCVHLVVCAVVAAIAVFVFERAAPVFYAMYYVVLLKEGECTEYCRFGGCVECCLYVEQRQGGVGPAEYAGYQHTYGGGAYAALFHSPSYALLVVHFYACAPFLTLLRAM